MLKSIITRVEEVKQITEKLQDRDLHHRVQRLLADLQFIQMRLQAVHKEDTKSAMRKRVIELLE